MDLNDLLNDAPQPEPPKSNPAQKLEEHLAASRTVHPSVFRKPVGIQFLADVCGKQPKQISKRLEKCPVAEWSTHQGKQVPKYDFLTAIAYLIPPKGNIEDWFGQQNAASLPPYVNKMWWDSANQRNRVMIQSGDLWHTEDVLLVFGRVAMQIRQDVKMWIEELPEKELLNDKQYGALIDATNRLVDEVRKNLVDMPRATLSMTAHIRSELDDSGKMPVESADGEDE